MLHHLRDAESCMQAVSSEQCAMMINESLCLETCFLLADLLTSWHNPQRYFSHKLFSQCLRQTKQLAGSRIRLRYFHTSIDKIWPVRVASEKGFGWRARIQVYIPCQPSQPVNNPDQVHLGCSYLTRLSSNSNVLCCSLAHQVRPKPV